MANNKIIYGNTTLIDLTSVTCTENDVLNGYTFHKANGTLGTGNVHYGATVSGTTLTLTGSVYNYPTWATGTVDDINNAFDLHRAGLINIYDYMSVGDERSIRLSTGETIIYVLTADQYTLSNGNTSLFGVEPKYIVQSGNMTPSRTDGTVWSNCSRRTALNSTYLQSFPESSRGLFKQFTSPYNTTDYFYLPTTSQAKVRTNSSGTALAHWTGNYIKPFGFNPRGDFYYITTSGTAYGSDGDSSCYGTSSKGLFPMGAIG